MADKLLPCPFCSGEGELDGHIEFSGLGNWYWIRCRDCKTAGPPHPSESKAIAAWNTRTERTCRMEYNEKASGDEIYPTEAYTCSLCRYVTYDGKPTYCPYCGAKVVN